MIGVRHALPGRCSADRAAGVVQPKKAINVMEATAQELVKVQRRAMKEYPFISSVYESVVITDAQAPDNPMYARPAGSHQISLTQSDTVCLSTTTLRR